MPGDTCYGGGEWDAAEASCPVSFGSHVGKMVLVLLILLAVSLLVVLVASKAEPGTPLAKFIGRVRGYFVSAKYRLVGAQAAPHSMAEDEVRTQAGSATQRSAAHRIAHGHNRGHGLSPDARASARPQPSHA